MFKRYMRNIKSKRAIKLLRSKDIFIGEDFSNLKLYGLDLSDKDFHNCDFINTNLSGCNFTDSTLENSNLAGANLDYTDFTGTDLEFTRLADCNLTACYGLVTGNVFGIEYISFRPPPCNIYVKSLGKCYSLNYWINNADTILKELGYPKRMRLAFRLQMITIEEQFKRI